MRNQIFKLFLSIMGASVIMFLLSISLSAHPMSGEKFQFKQPDGTRVAVKVFGDEYYQRVESEDGYTLVRNKKGSICYAKLDSSGKLEATNKVYNGKALSEDEAKSIGINKGIYEDKNIVLKHVKEKRSEIQLNAPLEEEMLAASPTPLPSGVPVIATATPSKVSGLVVLVDFPDVKSAVATNVIEQLFNKAGAGSVYDHFYNISGQKLEFTNKFIGFYTAKYEKGHYDSGTGYAGSTELMKEVCAWLNANQNFTTDGLSLNADKSIMAFTLLYAGTPDAGWANGLWPHSGGFSYVFKNGVRINSHQFSNIGSKPQTSTINHECEHMILKWPDYYDYDNDSKVIGKFNNFVNPYGRCVVSKFYNIKWLNGLPDGSVVTVPAGTRDVLGYINTKNNNEMFIVENIRKKGDWATFPGEGLIIWHIDRKGNNNYQDMTATKHYITSIEQADGKFDMEKNVNTGDTGDFFRAGYKDKFNDVTTPNSKWWNGTSSGFNISNVSAIGDNMTFVFSSTSDAITPKPTSTPTATLKPTFTPTVTPKPTYTPTLKPTITPTPTQVKTFKLSGYIAPDFTYSPDAAPIVKAGFKVELIGTNIGYAMTDSNGYFNISIPAAGTYLIKITKQGFLEIQIENVLINGDLSIGTQQAPVLLWAGDFPANGVQDSIVNMADLLLMAKVFNTTKADQNYASVYDVNSDGVINITDVIIIAKHFNATSSNYPQIAPFYLSGNN
ncbi:dockerin type I domain-containing protein [Pseudobacteroides cellulosolvens]|uniref:Dockerin domain-containing protein n=1 Tax=Pseudobacteroides cellulosolvens ATCC 35603 = DSM 2933 TaxID=398512 RepID=A0A0L6JU00_9FIRM|nr:dockerin type I domain-containing protein [Pseudobacteroides cellulosolvens]KNY29155.1 hypothetical protein Bccel_4429 [Pseudobacteroides cellulosolvens ATCC 35603 = DSM 2933]